MKENKWNNRLTGGVKGWSRSAGPADGAVTQRIHQLPAGTSVENVVLPLVSALDRLGKGLENLIVVVRTPDAEIVAVLPAADRKRIEEIDPRFRGKTVAIVEEEVAKALGIIPAQG